MRVTLAEAEALLVLCAGGPAGEAAALAHIADVDPPSAGVALTQVLRPWNAMHCHAAGVAAEVTQDSRSARTGTTELWARARCHARCVKSETMLGSARRRHSYGAARLHGHVAYSVRSTQ